MQQFPPPRGYILRWSEKYRISRINYGGILKVWYGQYKAREYLIIALRWFSRLLQIWLTYGPNIKIWYWKISKKLPNNDASWAITFYKTIIHNVTKNMQEKLETRPKVRGGNPIMNAQMQEKDTTMNKQTEMVSMNVIKDKQRHGNKNSKLESISRNKI